MKGNRFAGLMLIIFGSLYLGLQILNQLDIVLFQVWDLWPLFTITLGLLFEIGYFRNRKAPGLLIPGGILTVIGILHLFESITNWYFAAYTWPLYIFAILFGFLQYYIFTKAKWAWIVTVIFFCIFAFNAFIVVSMIINGLASADLALSAIIIIIGIIILLGTKFKHS